MNDAAQSSRPVETGRRTKSRLRLNLPGRLTSVDGVSRCLLVNVSGTGACIKVPEPPKIGRSAVLQCGDLDSMVTIVWVRGNLCGAEFDDDMAPAQLIDMRHKADSFNHAAHEREEQARAAWEWVTGKTR